MQEGKVFEERYIAYPDGKISKLDGTPLKKYISPYGYERVCINGKCCLFTELRLWCLSRTQIISRKSIILMVISRITTFLT